MFMYEMKWLNKTRIVLDWIERRNIMCFLQRGEKEINH